MRRTSSDMGKVGQDVQLGRSEPVKGKHMLWGAVFRGAFLAAYMAAIVPASGQSSEDSKWAAGELAHELTECVSYFVIVDVCFEKDPDPKTKAIGRKYLATAQSLAEIIAEAGNNRGV